MTPNNQQQILYKTMAEETEIAKENQQQVLYDGRFPCQDRNHISRNKETLSKGLKLLKRIIEK